LGKRLVNLIARAKGAGADAAACTCGIPGPPHQSWRQTKVPHGGFTAVQDDIAQGVFDRTTNIG